jgi:hypothetical protein
MQVMESSICTAIWSRERGYSRTCQRNLESSGNRPNQMRGDGNQEGSGLSTCDGGAGGIKYGVGIGIEVRD